jgi:glyoxylate carboligase
MVNDIPPTREAYYRVLARALPTDALVVTSLGNASYLWAVIRDRPENFYVEDAMGLALPLAIGLAVAQPGRQVVVVQGDGGLLMHMGALVTAGAVSPPNLTILLIDNGVHGASGGQALTSAALDYTALAAASGLRSATIDHADSLEAAVAVRKFDRCDPVFTSYVRKLTCARRLPAANRAIPLRTAVKPVIPPSGRSCTAVFVRISGVRQAIETWKEMTDYSPGADKTCAIVKISAARQQFLYRARNS